MKQRREASEAFDFPLEKENDPRRKGLGLDRRTPSDMEAVDEDRLCRCWQSVGAPAGQRHEGEESRK